ncbi:hypothetical protein [Nonomuraea sp. NPDC050786]|uniref:hypothetical protein n=1 Tax=Nonomuraea sp. NPDC050786 TaxID=3154840 RepID=UPI0033F73341
MIDRARPPQRACRRSTSSTCASCAASSGPCGSAPAFCSAWATVLLLYLALFAAVATTLRRWSRRAGWTQAHRLALVGGAMPTYAWHPSPWEPIPLPGEQQPAR